MKILIGSPVRQKPAILREFLWSLRRVIHSEFDLDYYFVDDNDAQESTAMLSGFNVAGCRKFLRKGYMGDDPFLCDEETHHWQANNIAKVAAYKDEIIQFALEKKYDYLFLIDSDVMIYPITVQHLASLEKDIVSEVYWTRWKDLKQEFPQIWLQDSYDFFQCHGQISEQEAIRKTSEFISRLRFPGQYRVGGLGACTLISRQAMQKGVRFKKLSNLSWAGEDRHFCFRADALGLELWADTMYPGFHIYRESDLEKAPQRKWWFEHRVTGWKGNRLALTMLVHNEEGKHLERALGKARDLADVVVVIDDASTDQTGRICKDLLANTPHVIHRNDVSMFGEEWKLRKLQWDLTRQQVPDWILNLDSDEEMVATRDEIQRYINQPAYDWWGFRLYDMWDEEHYRDDNLWTAHQRYHPFLVRRQPDFDYTWKEWEQHGGRLPCNIKALPGWYAKAAIKHWGWAREKDRLEKYERYRKLDKDSKHGIEDQYLSILDPYPHVLKFAE